MTKEDSSSFLAEGIFSWDVNGAEISESSLFSPYHTIGGARFRLGCRSEMLSTLLVANLYCNDDATKKKIYSTKVAYTLSLSSEKTRDCGEVSIFDTTRPLAESPLTVSALRKHGNILSGGHFTITAQIKVFFYSLIAIDFSSSADTPLADVTLLVRGKKFRVNRIFMAHHAGYFKTLFCSDFTEKNKDEIKIQGIAPRDFDEMLQVIYPHRKKITAETVVALLRMSDFFDVPSLRKECEQFLKDSDSFSFDEKLLLTEKYRLDERFQHCAAESEPIIGEGIIKWDLNVTELGGKQATFSPSTTIGGFPFRLGCRTVMNLCLPHPVPPGQRGIAVELRCSGDLPSKIFSANVSCTLQTPQPGGLGVNRMGSFDAFFHPFAMSHECPNYHCVQIGPITIEARIKVLSCHKNALIAGEPDFSDVTLRVGGREFRANKIYLAHYSGYFETLFCSGKDAKVTEFTLSSRVTADEFAEMLAAICPQREKVTAATVFALLRMANFFDVPILIKECTEYLKTTREFSRDAKAIISKLFGLTELHCYHHH